MRPVGSAICTAIVILVAGTIGLAGVDLSVRVNARLAALAREWVGGGGRAFVDCMLWEEGERLLEFFEHDVPPSVDTRETPEAPTGKGDDEKAVSLVVNGGFEQRHAGEPPNHIESDRAGAAGRRVRRRPGRLTKDPSRQTQSSEGFTGFGGPGYLRLSTAFPPDCWPVIMAVALIPTDFEELLMNWRVRWLATGHGGGFWRPPPAR